MKMPPDDWKDDRKLWDVLGSLKPAKPPSNFGYMVWQKLQEAENPVPTASSLVTLRRWVWGLAAAVACLLLTTVLLQYRTLKGTGNGTNGEGAVEVALIAENCEILQDLEVIENLDELL